MSCAGVTVGMSILFFILGVLSTTLFLVLLPHAHKKLVLLLESLVQRCARNSEGSPSTGSDTEAATTTHTGRGLVKSDNYAEIDANKTRTFTGANNGKHVHANLAYDTGPILRKHRQPDDNATYQNIGPNVADGTTSRDQERATYEALGLENADDKRFSNHTYCIIEPGTSRRLPVKRITTKADTLQSDENHLYFLLEPGTNKMKPVFQNEAEGSRDTYAGSDHTYFVLESTDRANADIYSLAQPHGVHDVASDHGYFILEKET